jgi:hypothetical protein
VNPFGLLNPLGAWQGRKSLFDASNLRDYLVVLGAQVLAIGRSAGHPSLDTLRKDINA